MITSMQGMDNAKKLYVNLQAFKSIHLPAIKAEQKLFSSVIC